MLPCLGSAMCACTWHFFYNSPDLQVSLWLLGWRCVLVVLPTPAPGAGATAQTCMRASAAAGLV